MGGEHLHTTLLSLVADIRNAIVGGPFGSNLVSRDYVESGVPVIRGKNMGVGKFLGGEYVFVSDEKAEALKANKARPKDLVFTQRGTLGQVAIVPEGLWDTYIVSQSQMKVTIDPSKANVEFLYYYFSSPREVQYIKSNAIQTGVPHINLTHLKEHPVRIPPLDVQKSIAHILGTLDDKIELNRQMNATLEAMAQALFKSWFVDFDPVIDNALAAGNPIPEPLHARAEIRKALGDKRKPLPEAIRKQFPSGFVFSEEMGWIPEGWEVGALSDVCFVKGGYAFKSKDFTTSGWPAIKIKNINSDRTINVSDIQYIPEEIAASCKNFWLSTGDLLMAMTGATVGKYGLLVSKSHKKYLLNQRVAKFHPLKDLSSKVWFSYCLLNQGRSVDYIVNIAHGSAQPNISADSIMSSPVIVPSKELVQLFDKAVDPYINKVLRNGELLSTLTTLRDTLLPKLLSGQLRIPEAEKTVREAL